MTNKSSLVISNQTDCHEHLEKVVKKHLVTPYLKPYHHFSEQLFEKLDKLQQKLMLSIILDSGCGTGESTINLAQLYSDHLIIGIDQSAHRLKKTIGAQSYLHKDNYIIARGDVIDLWRMINKAKWNIDKHYLLYPNPWPKKDQLIRRWHGHPVFPQMINFCKKIELRTNWDIYAREFKLATSLITERKMTINNIKQAELTTPFEKNTSQANTNYFVLL